MQQAERMAKGDLNLQNYLYDSIANSRMEYFKNYGITAERLAKCKKDIVVMHPGPINRGVEMSSEVADGKNSVILEQVTNGIAVRMAVLYLVSAGKESQ